MLIAENVGAYKIAPTKKLKMQIVIEIVDTVIFRGGRFLTRDSQGCWKDGGITLGKRKVGNAFRDAQRGRLRLTTNIPIDGNTCAVIHISGPQEDDSNSFESKHQHYNSNFELLPEGYHENKCMDQLWIEKSLVLEPAIDFEKSKTEEYWMNECLDDCMIDEISRLWK
jgi:hypothetical protein